MIPERPSRLRHVAAGAIPAAVVAAAAILVLAYPATQRAGKRNAARVAVAPETSVLVTYAGQPTPNPAIQVPRLKVVPASIADGPVHGAFSVPASQF